MTRVSGVQVSPATLHNPESVSTRLQETSLPSARSTSQLALSKSPLQAYGQRSAPTPPLNSRFYKLVAFFKSPLKFLAETWKRRATETQLSHLLKSDGSDINVKSLRDLFGNLSSLYKDAFVEKKEFYEDKLNKFWAHLNQLEGSNIRRIAEELTEPVQQRQLRTNTVEFFNHRSFLDNMVSKLSKEQIVHILSTKAEKCLDFWVPKLSAEDLASIQDNDQKKFDAITQHITSEQLINLINRSEDRNLEVAKIALNLSEPQLRGISVNFPDEFSNFIKSVQNKDLLDLLEPNSRLYNIYRDIMPLLQTDQIIFLISKKGDLDIESFREYIQALRADQLVNLQKASPKSFNTIICDLGFGQLKDLKNNFPDEFSNMAGRIEVDQLAGFINETDDYDDIAEILPKFSLEKIVDFYKQYFSKDDSLFTKFIVPAFSSKQLSDLWKSFPTGDLPAYSRLDEDFAGLYKKMIPSLSLVQIMDLQQRIPDAQFKQIVHNLSRSQLSLLKHNYPEFYSNSVEKYFGLFSSVGRWIS